MKFSDSPVPTPDRRASFFPQTSFC
ncbi:MAG: hypothetical protein JRJ23_08050 [Deltaproteobacteria bacterium]|nr:hypothetical protein [Deltaproteobacteria bacterium]